MGKTVFLFPGQGAQAVGMGRDLCESSDVARSLFEQAESVTGLSLKTLCFEGPQEELNRTDIAQPAIFTVSAAMLAVMADRLGDAMPVADAMAGLSLGEYTALYAAGAMDFETGVRLVARRGELMQQAATATPSSMVCVMGLEEAQAVELCQAAAEDQTLTCANFNAPGQIVLSGGVEACQRVVDLGEQFGASGVVPLQVAGAFHSDIMAPAAEELGKELGGIEFAAPRVPVISNVDAQPHAGDTTDRLLTQLTSSVRWAQSMENLLSDGLETPFEIGPGRVLTGLMRRINRKCRVTCVNSLEAIEALAGNNCPAGS
jgi:[acyl-carrier-protein] S-malonyltransferase